MFQFLLSCSEGPAELLYVPMISWNFIGSQSSLKYVRLDWRDSYVLEDVILDLRLCLGQTLVLLVTWIKRLSYNCTFKKLTRLYSYGSLRVLCDNYIIFFFTSGFAKFSLLPFIFSCWQCSRGCLLKDFTCTNH